MNQVRCGTPLRYLVAGNANYIPIQPAQDDVSHAAVEACGQTEGHARFAQPGEAIEASVRWFDRCSFIVILKNPPEGRVRGIDAGCQGCMALAQLLSP